MCNIIKISDRPSNFSETFKNSLWKGYRDFDFKIKINEKSKDINFEDTYGDKWSMPFDAVPHLSEKETGNWTTTIDKKTYLLTKEEYVLLHVIMHDECQEGLH